MSLFKDIVTLWNSDDLLSQAWDESYDMMVPIQPFHLSFKDVRLTMI